MELHNGKPEDDKFEVVRKLQGTSLCYVEEDSLLESLRGELPVALKKGDVVFTDECRGVRLLELEESGHEAGWRFDCNQLVGPDNKPLHASETLLSARLIHDLATYHATGKTPLMKAAEEGDITTVKFLLKRGANSEERSKNGQDTAIDLAKRNGHHNVVKYLRGAGKHSYLGQQRNSPGF